MSAPQSGHLAGSGSRTSMANCVMQPRQSPATVSRRSRRRRLQMRTQQRAAAHVSTARRTASSVPAANSSQPRMSPASSASPPGSSSTGSVPQPQVCSKSTRSPLRGPRNRSERQFQDRPPGRKPPNLQRIGDFDQCARRRPLPMAVTAIRRAARDAGQQTARRAVHPHPPCRPRRRSANRPTGRSPTKPSRASAAPQPPTLPPTADRPGPDGRRVRPPSSPPACSGGATALFRPIGPGHKGRGPRRNRGDAAGRPRRRPRAAGRVSLGSFRDGGTVGPGGREGQSPPRDGPSLSPPNAGAHTSASPGARGPGRSVAAAGWK